MFAEAYETRWYWCDIAEADESQVPDFSQVPEDKRDMVMSRWKEKQANLPKKRWQLWGPQIPTYEKLSFMQLSVAGPVE